MGLGPVVSAICRPTSESTWTERSVREHFMRSSCRTKVPKYVHLCNLFLFSLFEKTQPNPLTPFNNPKLEQTFVAKKL